jgi:hypothetical protein
LRNLFKIASFLFLFVNGFSLAAQFSPGKLSSAHADLEGLTNCTKCHELGAQVSEQLCLDCHKTLDFLINNNRGYHTSSEVNGKSCVSCHSEHHGLNFNSVRLDEENFQHKLTGYKLEGEHAKIDCRDCHKPDFIANAEIKDREETFLGMEQACLSCHDDYHQETLGQSCTDCHGFDDFNTLLGFDHDETEYPLRGAHEEVDCIKCHKESIRNGKDFQQFSDITFGQCLDCHDDEHEGKFGNSCTDCHGIDTWNQLKNINRFDHNLTDYPLEGQHITVSCKECHIRGDYKQEMAFEQCLDCHDDYHEGDFIKVDLSQPDCKECHSLVEKFSYSTFGLEDHQNSDYPLEGGHIATPCFACHKPSEDKRWDFKFNSTNCIECHLDIHEGFIDSTFYPRQDCKSCHQLESWARVDFDHKQTDWPLELAHQETNCRACHFKENPSQDLGFDQEFENVASNCYDCHLNIHGDQFKEAEITDCQSCHTAGIKLWEASVFNHDKTEFPLEGSHQEVDCKECHKKELRNDFGDFTIDYNLEKFQCIDCHSS